MDQTIYTTNVNIDKHGYSNVAVRNLVGCVDGDTGRLIGWKKTRTPSDFVARYGYGEFTSLYIIELDKYPGLPSGAFRHQWDYITPRINAIAAINEIEEALKTDNIELVREVLERYRATQNRNGE